MILLLAYFNVIQLIQKQYTFYPTLLKAKFY